MSALDQAHSEDGPGPRSASQSTLTRLLFVVAGISLSAGTFLLWSRLAAIGLTTDESVDFEIAAAFSTHFDVFRNQADPSQSRLPHMLAGVMLRLFGQSLFVFKAPFAALVMALALFLPAWLRRYVGRPAAWLAGAFFLTNAYVLGSGRAAATAGDAAVLVAWSGTLVSLIAWHEHERFLPWGIVTAVAAGLAIGSKWTSVVLLAAPAVLIRLAADGWWKGLRNLQLPWFLTVATSVACLANPLFLQGPAFVANAWQSSSGYFDHLPEYYYFGAWWPSSPWFYVPVLLIVKFTPFLIVLAAIGARAAWRGPLAFLTRASVAMIAVQFAFGWKNFQNAYYYIATATPLSILSALAVDAGLRRRGGWAYATASAAVVILAINITVALRVRPDFMQAGSEYGDLMQGEFNGPAVNHCQGAPLAVPELVTLNQTTGIDTILLAGCWRAWRQTFDLMAPAVSFTVQPLDRKPQRPYLLVVPQHYFYEEKSAAKLKSRLEGLADVSHGCSTWRDRDRDPARPFQIYICAGPAP